MIRVLSDKGHLEIEIEGNLHDIGSEFTHLCINLAEKIGEELEVCGRYPEREGSIHAIATIVTCFVLEKAECMNPLVLLVNSDKVVEFGEKTKAYINDCIKDFSSDTVKEIDIDLLAGFLGKIFGVKAKSEPAEPVPEEAAEAEGGCSDNEQSV